MIPIFPIHATNFPFHSLFRPLDTSVPTSDTIVISPQVRTLPPKETQTELHDINVKQLEMERQGVELEKTIRQLTEQDDKQQKGGK